MRALIPLTVALLALLLAGFASGRRAPRCGVVPSRASYRAQQITFARHERGALRLDLVVPEGAGPRPLVVLVHGGAWRRGRRGYMNGTMHALADRGYAAATVDYRLADGARDVFPEPISDVRCAVRTLRERATELGLDGSRFAVVGFSAGGHLASLIATASDVPSLDDGTCPAGAAPARVQAAVAFYGPSDLRAPLRVGPGGDGAIRNLLGVSRTADPARAALASPVAHVDGSDPPMMLVHGLSDRIVDVDQTRRMHAALENAGVPVVALELPGRSHGFGAFPRRRGEDDALSCAMLAFLSEHLRPRR